MIVDRRLAILLVLARRLSSARHRPDERQLVPRRGRVGPGPDLLAAHFPAGANVPSRRDRPARRRQGRGGHGGAQARDPAVAADRAAAGQGPPGTQLSRPAQGRPVLDRGVRPDPAPARRRQAGGRTRRRWSAARRRESYDLRGRPPRATTSVIIPIALARRVRDPRAPAARAARAGAARRDDRSCRSRAALGARHLRLRARLRLPGRRTRRCRCSRSSSSSRSGSTTTSS